MHFCVCPFNEFMQLKLAVAVASGLLKCLTLFLLSSRHVCENTSKNVECAHVWEKSFVMMRVSDGLIPCHLVTAY